MFNISLTPGSTLSYGGATYTPTAGHQPMLELMGNNINLWAVWSAAGCASCATLGDTLKNIDPTGYTHTPAGGSSGGVAVPEPGMVGLMGLGVAALVARRRRGARAAGAVATA
ncbi:MAG: PEP-CTERM sorting domain-containing protein [Proteobacteria bacterium]|nr:PEP-CTERM sorting domain-containing protein [Pseudomonadota bacterium]